MDARNTMIVRITTEVNDTRWVEWCPGSGLAAKISWVEWCPGSGLAAKIRRQVMLQIVKSKHVFRLTLNVLNILTMKFS